MEKPIIVFTNFWDAEKIINQDHLVSYDEKSFYKVRLYKDPRNFTVKSIALAHPNLDKLPTIKSLNGNSYSLPRLDFFCPTYEMLMDYKQGGSWDDYTTQYRKILKDRKDPIVNWFESLIPGKIYILCCWENTSKGANCHRELIYDAFTQSKTLKDKALYIKRTGGVSRSFKDSDLYKMLKSDPSMLVINDNETSLIPSAFESEFEALIKSSQPLTTILLSGWE